MHVYLDQIWCFSHRGEDKLGVEIEFEPFIRHLLCARAVAAEWSRASAKRRVSRDIPQGMTSTYFSRKVLRHPV